jgi:uracil-DNA glycosylase
MGTEQELEELQQKVVRCRKCPRLTAYLREVEKRRPRRYREWHYWSKPLPSFGDANAGLLIVGLAPAAQGGNRTGRMFAGDRSGEWLFRALHEFGFANQANSTHLGDGLKLKNCYITATIRCVPPQNKPLPAEIENCRPYFLREMGLLRNVKVIVPLGQIALTQTIKSMRQKEIEVLPLDFGHGRVYPLENGQTIITTYHPSQQNTQTGKLTKPMFHKIFRMVRKRLEA